MKHLGTKTLETNRLLLRQFVMEDAQAVYHNWANDDEVTKYLIWPTHDTVETSKVVLANWISHYGEADFYQWAIVLKENGNEPIGSISVVHRNDRIEMVHIGYCIGRRWWHQGIMSEALKVLIEFFIHDVGINRIESRHDSNNPNSGKVMAKCGMKYEGTKRQGDFNNQGICDCVQYALLAEDFAI